MNIARPQRLHFAVSLLLFGVAPTLCLAADPKPLEIGSPAPDFNLPGVDGKDHALKHFAAAKVLVVLFTCNHCPTAQAYEGRILKMHADYKDKGVALVAISPNDPLAVRLDELGYTDVSDSLEDMKIRAKDRGFQFPYLYDGETQKASRAYGVLATPHVFIFDQGRRLRYQGRIDDAEVRPDEVKSHDARNAIDALLAGKPVAVAKTNVPGCSTKWSDKREDAKRSLEKWDKEPVSLEPIDPAGVKAVAAFRKADAKPGLRLVNVWATWCAPCVAELPELVTMQRMYRHRGFELVTISMDEPEQKDAALDFLKQRHVSGKNYVFSGEDKDQLVASLDPEWQGPVPHTMLIAPGGKVIYRKTGQIDPLEVKRAIADYLGRTYGPEKKASEKK
jgi:peroxiredoxin